MDRLGWTNDQILHITNRLQVHDCDEMSQILKKWHYILFGLFLDFFLLLFGMDEHTCMLLDEMATKI